MSWSAALGKTEQTPTSSLRATATPSGRTTTYGQRALERECSELASTAPGQRNDRLNIAAFAIGQLVAGGEIDEGDAVFALSAAARQCGLGDREIGKTLASGLSSGKREPREAPPLRTAKADDDFGPVDYGDMPETSDRRPAEPPADQPPVPLPWLETATIFEPLPPVPYVLGALDICPGAPALVAGYGFSGKTVACQSLALSVATGGLAWGTYPVSQGRVCHIDYEQGSRLTRERYQRLALGMDVGPSDIGDRLRLATMPPMYLDGTAAEDVLCRELDGCTLAIVDSLRAAAPSVEENSSDVRRVLDMLGRVSERTGCAAIVIHHSRKPQRDAPGGAKMAIRGSGAIFDACGSVLVFEAAKGMPTTVSHEKARTSGVLAEDFSLTIADVPNGGDERWGLIVSAEAVPRAASGGSAALDRAKEQIRAYLIEHGSAPSKNAALARIGGDRTKFYAAVGEMVRDGEVEMEGTSFRLASEGGTR